MLFKHGLRNAMIPTVTILGVLLGGLLSGSVVIETILQWPGIGLYLERSILSFDFPSIVGVAVLAHHALRGDSKSGRGYPVGSYRSADQGMNCT